MSKKQSPSDQSGTHSPNFRKSTEQRFQLESLEKRELMAADLLSSLSPEPVFAESAEIAEGEASTAPVARNDAFETTQGQKLVVAEQLFAKTFDLRSEEMKTPFYSHNASMLRESFSPNVYYWQPSSLNQWAEVTYKVEVPFEIDHVDMPGLGAHHLPYMSVYNANADVNFDSGARGEVQVSVDNQNWFTLYESTPEGGRQAPNDINDIVAGHDTFYFKGRMYATRHLGCCGLSQFLRSSPERDSFPVLKIHGVAGVLQNDADPNGDRLTADLLRQPSNGQLVLNEDGFFEYTPNSGFAGLDTFSYTASDGNEKSNPATVAINVKGTNNPPTLDNIADPAPINEDAARQSVRITGISSGDTRREDLELHVSTDNPQLLTNLEVNYNQGDDFAIVSYTPAADAFGKAEVTVTVEDDGTDCKLSTRSDNLKTSQSFTVVVNPVNDLPLIDSDVIQVTIEEDSQSDLIPFTISDVETPADRLEILIESGDPVAIPPENIVITGEGNQRFVQITPDPDQHGHTHIVLTVMDEEGALAQHRIQVDISCINDAPVATDDQYSVDRDSRLIVPSRLYREVGLGVTAEHWTSVGNNENGNDFSTHTESGVIGGRFTRSAHKRILADTDLSTVLSFDQPFSASGVLEIGDINVPDFGNGMMIGHFDDGSAAEVDEVRDGPVEIGIGFTDNSQGNRIFWYGGIMDHGGLMMPATGMTEITPNSTHLWSYEWDPAGGDGNGIFKATLDGVSHIIELNEEQRKQLDQTELNAFGFAGNAASHPNGGMYADIYMKHASYTSGQQKGVLENDYDVDLDPLESKLVSQPEHGTLELNKDGSFIYTPDEGYHGNDSFSYTAYDGEASSNVAVVSIEVICTNTPPVAVDDAFQIDNKSILQGENLLENDNDVDGDTLTAKVISNVEHGTVEILDDGTFTYRPDPGFFGTDSFTYVANDGHEDSNVAVVTIEVSDANDAPFFVYEELSTNPDLEGAIQWKAVDGGNNHWYKLVMDPEQDWEQAQAKAEAMGGYLATLTSAEEDAFVLENLLQPSSQWSSTVGPWLGGFQNTNSPDYSEPAGGWEWVTGEPMEFTNWRPGEPNNTGNEGYMHYDNINTNSPSWNDIPEGRHRVPGFLVEMDQATYQDQYHAGIYRPQELTRIDQPWVGGNNGQNAMVISDHHVITKTSNGNGSAIVWSINDDNTLTKLTEIQSPDSTAASSFGWAINAEGNYLGIGSRFASNQAIHAGRYYVYDVNDFSLKTSFNPSPENAGYFASEGDLSNDVLVVGETGNWGSWNTEAAITAYKVSTTNPSAEQIFREEITSEGTGGSRIAGLTISGDVVIGRFERETEDDWQIIMWNIVRNEDGDPTSLQKVHTMTEAKGVNLLGEGGEELLTNGQYLAAGIPAGTVGDSQPGRVELVRITDSNELVHDRTITAPETADGMKFGESILFDGNLLYVSAPMEDVNQSGTGKVYVYDLNNEASFKHPMMFTGTDLQTGDRFGGELSLAGDRLAISAGEDSLYLFQKARLTNVSNVISIFEFCEIDNPGNSIAEYVEHHIEDLDIDAVEGIAIIGTTHFEDGSWQYSLDNKDNWVTLDDVSDLNALLLRPEDHLRFVPNHQCSDWGSVEYRAWDQTGGTADDYGQYTTINETGDDSPFSDTTAISVVTINLEHHHDENQLTDDHFEIMEDAGTTTLDVLANDELVSGTITNITQSALGSQVAISDDGLTVNYTPAENVYGLETLDYTVTAEDGTNTQATISIDLKPVNDAPTILIGKENIEHTYKFASVADSNAGDYLISAEGVRIYSEWQNPPIKYYGPSQNGVPGELVYRFSHDNPITSADLQAWIGAWNLSDFGGGQGRGEASLHVSSDGNNWLNLLDIPVPSQQGIGETYDDELPEVILGGTDIWLKVNLQVSGAPNSSYTVAQFSRSNAHPDDKNAPSVFELTTTTGGILERLTLNEDAGEQTVSLTNITAGPNESQPLSVLAESDNTGLISEIHVSYDSPGSVGELHFTPAANQHGQATISVTVEDGGLDNDLSTVGDNLTTTETFEVIVTPDNDTPLANNDAYTVWEDSHSNMLDVLSNDTHSSDAGETFLITEIDAANVLGDLEIVADGEQISYTPQPNFSGIETFTYTITDNEGSRATASVSIEVKETNDAPVAVDDAFEVNEDSVNNTLDVLANDHDGGDPGDSIRILDVNHQQVTIAEDGLSLNYTPESDFHGQLEFSYSIVDQGGDTSSANVTLTVNNVGDAPVAIDDHYQFLQTDDIIVLGLTQNDSAGPDANSSIQIIDISNTDSGNDVTIGQDGQSVTYHNYNGISGLDRFTYTIENQDGLRDSATVTLELERVNHDPDARDDYFTITDGTQNQTLDVLANDSTMPDTGEVLTITEVHNDSDSLVEISSDGKTLLFSTLETGDASQKQFTYTISDGNGGVAEANVIVEIDVVIEPPSDDPEAGLQETYSALELDDNGYALLDVLKNERLAPGYFNEPMELVSIEYNGDGSAVINTDQNAILYHPGDDLVTTESITYTFTDSIHSHYQATATIQIAEHSQQDDMVQFMPVIYETGTNNIIHEVDVDQPFDIAVTVQDIRPEILDHYAGVFAAYMDVLYTSEAIELDADSLQYSAQYRNAVSGDLDSLGCIDEVGAMQAGFSPLGTDALELFRITATGIDVGVTEIQTNPADIDLVSDTLVFEPPSALLDTQIDYATATLEILTPDPYGHLDINDDGQVTPIDALHLVNDLNFNGARPLNLDAEMLEAEGEVIGAGHRARHLDVNRDNYISPLDALAIINHLNAPPEMAEGEGPILTDMGLQQDRITRTDNLPETIVATEAIQLQATPEAQRESWSQQVESVFESFELQQIEAEDDLLELISKKD